MLLFDQGERAELGPQKRTQPAYAYLNTAARPDAAAIRAMLTQWFTHYPIAHRASLRAAFASKRDRNHCGAFFELLLHELFRLQKARVDVSPKIVGLRKPPDFAIDHPKAGSFLLEATVATQTSDHDQSVRAGEAPVYDALDRIVSPNFWLSVEFDGEPRTTPPTKRLVRELTAWLAQQDHGAACARIVARQHDQLPRCEWKHDGWHLRFQAIPKGPNLRGRPGRRTTAFIAPRFAILGLTADALRDAITEKATQYGRPPLPYVIAVGIPYHQVAHEVLRDALFGQSGVLAQMNEHGDIHAATATRRVPAAWVGPQQPRNTRVSAVLIVHRADPWSFSTGHIELIRNPFAQRPMPTIPRIATCSGGANDPCLLHAETPLRGLLALPAAWPPPFTPFALAP